MSIIRNAVVRDFKKEFGYINDIIYGKPMPIDISISSMLWGVGVGDFGENEKATTMVMNNVYGENRARILIIALKNNNEW